MRAPLNLKRNKQSGFTIIEVMIVLAVAALIMLIVFLAVPALQRNARNTNRTADATKVAGGINECLANKNGTVSKCNTDAQIWNGATNTLDTATLKQLTTVSVNSGAAPASPTAFPADNATAKVYFASSCTSSGDDYTTGANANQFVVLYNNEGTGGSSIHRCVGN